MPGVPGVPLEVPGIPEVPIAPELPGAPFDVPALTLFGDPPAAGFRWVESLSDKSGRWLL